LRHFQSLLPILIDKVGIEFRRLKLVWEGIYPVVLWVMRIEVILAGLIFHLFVEN
jgi:hypothetical protein